MTPRRHLLASLSASFALFVSASGAFAADDLVARFEGSTVRNVGGHSIEVVALSSMSNGKNLTIPVPNEEVKKGSPAVPRKEIDAAVKKLTPGQIVKFTTEPNKEMGTAVLSTIELYELKPGEDTPNGYVFAKTFDKPAGKTTTTMVVLTKYGVEHNFTVLMKKGEKGEQEQDPDVTAAIAKLTEGSPVWVQSQGKSVITGIEPYTEPLTGKVTKVYEGEADSHKTKAVDIETDGGKTVSAFVPGKENGKVFAPDTAVVAELAKVKVGSQVEFRVREDGGTSWLREIEVVKPTKKPVETTPKKTAEAKPPAAAKK